MDRGSVFSGHPNFSVSYCFAIKATKHKISKLFTVTCVDMFVQIDQLYNVALKQCICFTKLLLPCTSLHVYLPKQSPIVFLQLLYKLS